MLDGWGLAPAGPGNAISLADTPVFDELWAEHPHTQLIAMGARVGLPAGQMGNSEVGHLNLGAGAIVPQDLTRIDEAVEDGSLAENEVLHAALKDAPRVHLIGLVSDGGVHSSDRHLQALIELAAERASRPRRPRVHRRPRHVADTRGAEYVAEVEGWLREPAPAASARSSAATSRWTATSAGTASSRPTTCSSHGKAEHHADTGEEAAQAAYERDETDEFITRHDRRRRGARSAPATP